MCENVPSFQLYYITVSGKGWKLPKVKLSSQRCVKVADSVIVNPRGYCGSVYLLRKREEVSTDGNRLCVYVPRH